MREIKFRAWTREEYEEAYEMSESFRVTDLDGYYCMPPITWADKKDVILMQYTGLKDKNGKEIYEGDILEDDAYWYEVVWSINRGAWLAQGCRGTDHDIEAAEIAASRDCCRAGNIYENPELLTA